MKKYKAYLKQDGEGCDYTIGCGQTLIDIEAENIKDAKIQLKEIIADEYNNDECRLETVEIYEISWFIDFDIQHFYEQLEKMQELANNKLKDESDILEYERLKIKFGKEVIIQ